MISYSVIIKTRKARNLLKNCRRIRRGILIDNRDTFLWGCDWPLDDNQSVSMHVSFWRSSVHFGFLCLEVSSALAKHYSKRIGFAENNTFGVNYRLTNGCTEKEDQIDLAWYTNERVLLNRGSNFGGDFALVSERYNSTVRLTWCWSKFVSFNVQFTCSYT